MKYIQLRNIYVYILIILSYRVTLHAIFAQA